MDDVKVAPRTQEELVKIAEDMVSEKIFCDGMVRDGCDALVYNLFLPLIKVEQMVNWDDVGMIYEYVDKSVGEHETYPVFNTVNFVHESDMPKLQSIFKEMKVIPADGHSCSGHSHVV